MMLATNIDLKSKDDLIKTTSLYLDRWRIEEYFKFKKQEYNFENFRVRNFKSINNLNKMLTYAIGLIAMLSDKIGKRKFVHTIINETQDGTFWNKRMAKYTKTKAFDGQLSLL